MGYGTFDTGASAARAAYRSATGTSAFKHDADIAAGRVAKGCHASLDTKNKNIRECLDNEDNPTSVPIGIIVDVTGSMGEIADLVIKDLHKVIKTIKDRGAVPYPSILFGGVGDAYTDRAPLQLGEFESDDELAEAHLGNIYREGNGGGQARESYEIPLWFFANQVTTDHWNKRGQKGFLFLIGDENYYPNVNAQQIEKLLGLTIEDTSTKAVAEMLLERWHVFCIRPGQTSHFNSAQVQNSWVELLGPERVMKVEDWHEIVSLIAGTISVISGLDAATTLTALSDDGMIVGDATKTALNSLAIIDTSAISATNADLQDSSGPATRL